MPHDNTLESSTRKLLKHRPSVVTLASICKGTGLSSTWVGRFLANRDKDYTIRKVQKLHDYLQELTAALASE